MSEKTSLKRVLHTRDLIALALGAAIGWAWVSLSGEWILLGGTLGAVTGFAIGGIMVFFVGMTYAELCAAMPKCGGEHVFSLRALGFHWSFVCSWALTLSYLGVVAFEACSLPSVLGHITPGIRTGLSYTVAGTPVYLAFVLIGVAGAVVLTVINYIGIEFASWVQQACTIVILVVGLLMIAAALTSGELPHAQPLFVNGSSGVISVAVITPFFMVGFDVIPQAAEEVDLPPRKMGRLMLLSIFLAASWYCLIIFCVSLLMGHGDIQSADLCTADALTKAWHGSAVARYVVVGGGMCGILTSWNAFLTAGSRVLFSMGQSGMLPRWFAKLHPKYKTPSHAVLFIGGVSAVAPFFGRQFLSWISSAASLSTVIAYGLVAVSFLVLRKREPDMLRPHKIRHGRIVGWVAVVLTVGMAFLYLPHMPSGLGAPEWVILLIWAAFGIVVYRGSSHRRAETFS